MWKSLARSLLGDLVMQLPWGARNAIFQTLVDDIGKNNLFIEMARKFNVESLSISGANGSVWGSINDKSVLGRYMLTGVWAPITEKLFENFFSENGGGTFLDIGANIGLTLIPIARNPDVQCFGFEPEPRNFFYLKHNIEMNCLHGNVSLEQLALFDHKDVLQFELSSDNFGDHRIRTSDHDGYYVERMRETVSVVADRLDSIIEVGSLKRPLTVKMDTQGAEPNIIAGGMNVLSAADLIALEFWPYGMRRIGGDVNAEIIFLLNNFREGSIVKGDSDAAIQWCPIRSITEEMQELWEDKINMTGPKYYDVFVRK
jgi:FkbM family methyltransferase